MSHDTKILLEAARLHRPTEAEKEEHRRSFAYGNTKIENARITRELVDQQAETLKQRPNQESKRSPKVW